MSDEDVAKEAKERGCTRAAICMERGAALAEKENVIFAIGNAPTALIRLYELIKEGHLPVVCQITEASAPPVIQEPVETPSLNSFINLIPTQFYN